MDMLFVAYCIGFLFAWIIATTIWICHWRDYETIEIFFGAVWGLLGAIVWPFWIPILIIAGISLSITKRTT